MTNKQRYIWAMIKIWKGNEFLKWMAAGDFTEAVDEFRRSYCYDRAYKHTERTIDDYYVECYRYDRQLRTWDQENPVMHLTGREILKDIGEE